MAGLVFVSTVDGSRIFVDHLAFTNGTFPIPANFVGPMSLTDGSIDRVQYNGASPQQPAGVTLLPPQTFVPVFSGGPPAYNNGPQQRGPSWP